jgi:methylase of polypeptide subunit release factors
MKLSKELLIKEAKIFCDEENITQHPQLTGVTDGKSIGTYIEKEFKDYLSSKYTFNMGSVANGIDFPDEDINTDIKVTSKRKPQNSCPFTDIRQKIYGLGYNILLFVYDNDIDDYTDLKLESCTFIKASETGDYNLTKNLIKMLKNNKTADEITDYLIECKVPGTYETLKNLACEIIENPPRQGYLTISNALQWRLKYNHVEKEKYTFDDTSKKEYGDYQTPQYFADMIVKYTKETMKLNPDLIIEPTCGVGNFIKACREYYPNTSIVGVDINNEYLRQISDIDNLTLYHGNIFDFDFNSIKKESNSSYLIIGNPPWVTNTRLSKIESDNTPPKHNYKHLEFFHAITGESNFDISESIILSFVNEFKELDASIVFLCKYKVACNIFEYITRCEIEVSHIQIIKFSSMKVFKADTSSCILIIKFNDNNNIHSSCIVSNMDNPEDKYRIGIVNGKFYSNMDKLVDIDGECPFEWRQGIKHDCVKVMELETKENGYKNKQNDTVVIEDNLLYPLLKSSSLKKAIITGSSLNVIITQHEIKEDTGYIETSLPLTWSYLNKNREYFDKRKSSIYKNCPDYSIFGVGEYTFKKYKVAISGFYAKGLFTLVYADKPMMLDDTCYYISFDDYDTAYVSMLILNSNVVHKFLENIIVVESKRPYTKKVLRRIDIKKAVDILGFDDLKETEKSLDLKEYITKDKFENYVHHLNKS